ncbi:MAG: nucleoside permease [Bacteroidetes bacterium GWC2_33_15]|nr:MAG: nucleoside permease [Bacteroidetes bacterium GWA2_33_15]OFX49219.1 MAG: nucleoside permease [Bacteroidetes bacterium GWC2_33_15]OFX64687.1 MAG: nucleoside permease [Bacteroidetes bacterium GWB2_32_14]OFX69134.1 MAG: nucleoside permease [Bacteroidetes bacterium GWD2_33_33]HAN17623.1 MFS transporter [Bacteroidales bacterium]
MNIKNRLILMNFFQFFIWGSWLLTIGAYWFQTKQWSGTEFGAIFSTMGIASLFMPAIAGIIADRWINAEKLFGSFHIIAAVILFLVPLVNDPSTMFWIMLVNMMFYMPTISLSITVAYSSLNKSNLDIVKEYPPIRVWGTIGFIAALWIVSLANFETSAMQFYVASAASLFLGIYAFTLPKCEPLGGTSKKSFINALGLNAFALFKNARMAIFFIFAMLLGASLQLTNAYGDTFLHDFAKLDVYKDLLAVKFPAIIMSISQISETLFILTIPFFLRKFGIKKVMLMSMFAWVLRFGLFAYGDPAGGLWMIILSCIIYGMAFDFFNISGSLYVESQSEPGIRASAQGLFMMMTNGFGAFLGSRISGIVIDKFYKIPDAAQDAIQYDWKGIWLAFAAYSLLVAVIFAIVFKYKHDPKVVESFQH